ncbi:MAG: AsmA family protein [bacterium]
MNKKKFFIIVAGAALLLFVAAVTLLFVLVNPETFRGTIKEKAEAGLNGREVSLGPMSLDLWPGIGLAVDGLEVKERGPDAPLLARADGLVFRVALFPLLDRRLEVTAIEMNSPSMRLVRTGEKEWNISDLTSPAEGDTAAPSTAGAGDDTEESKGGLRGFHIDSVIVSDGYVEVLDETTAGREPIKVRLGSLEVEDIREDKASSIKVAASFADRPGKVSLSGEAGPLLGKDAVKNMAADLEAEFKDMDIRRLINFAPPGSVPVDIKAGAMNGKIRAQGNSGKPFHIDLDMLLAGLSYTDTAGEWPESEPADVAVKSAVSFDSAQGKAVVESGAIGLPAGEIDFSGFYEKGKDESGPDIEMSAASESVLIEKLLPLVPVASQPLTEAGLESKGPLSFKVDFKNKPGKAPVLPVLVNLSPASVVLPGTFEKGAGKPGKLSLLTTLEEEKVKLHDIKLSLGPLDFKGAGRIQRDKTLTTDINLESGRSDTQAVLAMFPSLSNYRMGGNMSLGLAVKGGLSKKETLRIILSRLDQASDSATFSANGSIKMTTPVDISFNLEAGSLNLDKVMGSPASKGEKAPEEGKAEEGKESARSNYVIAGTVKADRVVYKDMEIKNINASPSLKKDILTVPDTSLLVFDAPVKGPVKLDFTGKDLTGDLDISTEGIPLERVIKKFTEFPALLTGDVFGGVNLTFKGTDSVKLTKTANGSGRIKLQKGVLKGMDLVDGLLNQWASSKAVKNVVRRSLDPAISKEVGEETPFQDLVTTLKINKGRFHLDKSSLNLSEGMASLQGSVGMDKTIDMNGTLKLNKSTTDELMKEAGKWIEKQSGGSVKSGILNVLLEDGRLVLPFSMGGVFPKPKLAFDSRAYSASVERNLKNRSAREIIDQVATDEQKAKGQKEADKAKKDLQKKAEDALGEKGKDILDGLLPK